MNATDVISESTVMISDNPAAYPTRFWVNASL
jgi:hypothetical protein